MFSFTNSKPNSSINRARKRIEDVVRSKRNCREDDHILVQELSCLEPDCPPKETLIAIFTEGQPPLHFRIHKGLADVTENDLSQAIAES
jgi:hypothetical protein